MRAFEGVDVPNGVLNNIHESVVITDYDLRSVLYQIKNDSAIKGFQGEMKFQFVDSRSNASAILMLLIRYACYCGIGAKTALGMGGILLNEQG